MQGEREIGRLVQVQAENASEYMVTGMQAIPTLARIMGGVRVDTRLDTAPATGS